MKLAVIVPCRNEQTNIEECIEAIFRSYLPENMEIEMVVVDGKSTDETLEKIASLKKNHTNLHVVVNEKQMTPFAFNLGIDAISDADFYQIVGARQIVSSDYLSKATDTLLKNPEIWCVGGAVENVYLNRDGEIIAYAMSTALGMGLGNFRTLNESGYVDTVGTPLYPKSVFEKIGYFDEELIRNQDDDFNFRVTQAGGKIFYNHEISLKYYVRGSFSGLWRQFFQYGYWKVYVNQKHKTVTTIRQLVPPAFVLYLILLPFLSLLSCYLALPLALYLLLCVGIALPIALSKKLPAHKLIFTYFVLHVSYGLGYLKGIWEFLLLQKKPSDKQKRLSR